MEILTWVLEGAVEHRDSTGGSGVIRPGELQHMTAGRGVVHSEFNPSKTDPTHLLQIWILPNRRGLEPGYEQLAFSDVDLRGKFELVGGPKAPITIHQDAKLYIARLDEGGDASQILAPGRHGWLQVAKGSVKLNGLSKGTRLQQGDGAAILEESNIRVEAAEASEVLLFDLG
jgi:redox-sensitive bicupin YhaK (pirin superfamily)